MAYETVLSPIEIGAHTIPNRVVMPAHTVLFGEDHLLSDRHVAYYRERAMGGTGLIIAEGGAVHRESRGAFLESISAYEPECIPRYEKLANACHEHGAKVFTQLFSLGVHMHGTFEFDDWVPLWAPSRVPSVREREVPLAMEREHIRALVEGFGISARNVEIAGLDGVELHAAHSYLLGTFLSPAYNRRTDEYGGSVANRVRIVLECAEEVRRRTGDGFALGVRLSFDEWIGDAGIQPEASEEALEIMAASGLFDFFNISAGGYHTGHRMVPVMNEPEGLFVPYGARAKEVVRGRAKVMIVGRIPTLELADRIVAEGAADLVCMTRAHMVDAFLVKKAAEGRARETQLCVAANECFVKQGKTITCMMNPIFGRERRWGHGTLQPADRARRVLVVGGGPAGMRAASVAASRGHRVTLVEASEELGGHLNLIKRLPTRDGWQRAVDNLRIPLETYGVEVRTGVRADAALVAAEGAEAVVCATGSTWNRNGFTPLRPDRGGIPGADHPFVLDVGTAIERALAEPGALGARVLVYDETGTYLPLGLAELAADQGSAVEVATPNPSVGEMTAATSDMPYLFPRLVAKGVALTAQVGLEEIGAGGEATLVRAWGAGKETREVDTVVLCQYRTPDDALFERLRASGPELHRIGDCLAPRRTAVAIYEGEQLGRSL